MPVVSLKRAQMGAGFCPAVQCRSGWRCPRGGRASPARRAERPCSLRGTWWQHGALSLAGQAKDGFICTAGTAQAV